MLKELIKERPFIIAEVGGNHEGDFEYAQKLLKEAVKTGVSAVKFQIYQGEKLVNKKESPDRARHFNTFELSERQWEKLIKMAKDLDVMFMSSIWDIDAIDKYDPHIQIHKVGSGDLTAYPILQHLAKKDKPIILSTAMANMEEVREAIEVIKEANPGLIQDKDLAILHCVAMYGDPKAEYANLLSIEKLRNEFPELIIGYSDHTEGIYACELAIGMGAQIIEKHFTDDKTRKFRDHHIAANTEEMKGLVSKSKLIRLYQGEYEKKPIPGIETKKRIQEFRRGVYPRHDLSPGTILTEENLVILRPNKGIDARDFKKILGKKLNVAKKALEPLNHDDLS